MNCCHYYDDEGLLNVPVKYEYENISICLCICIALAMIHIASGSYHTTSPDENLFSWGLCMLCSDPIWTHTDLVTAVPLRCTKNTITVNIHPNIAKIPIKAVILHLLSIHYMLCYQHDCTCVWKSIASSNANTFSTMGLINPSNKTKKKIWAK